MNLQDARKKLPELEGLSDESALNVIHQVYYPNMDKADLASRLGYKAPEAPVPERSTMRAVGDLATQFGTGAVSGVRMMTDMFGADNRVSQGLRSAEEALGGLLSAQALGDQRKISEIMKEAEGKGWGDQVLAGLKAAGVAPGALLAQAAGTSIPTLATALIPGAGPAAVATRMGAAGAMGAAQGAGNIKGVIYEDVKKKLSKDPSLTPDQIEARAVEAQSFAGPNSGQIALGGALGMAAGTTGMEKVVSGLRNGVTKTPAGLAGRMVGGGAAEAVPEFGQGAQEKYASNTALNNEGFDVDPMSGVIAQGTMEAAAGFGAGALTGIPKPKQLNAADVVANAVLETKLVPETGPMTRAANVATALEADKVRNEVNQSLTGATMTDMLQGSGDPLQAALAAQTAEQPAAPVVNESLTTQPAADQLPDTGGMGSPGIDLATGEVLPPSAQPDPLDFTGKTDEELQAARQGAQSPAIRNAIAKELQARRAAAEPVEPVTDSLSAKLRPVESLPKELAGAKEKYNYGNKSFTPQFESDVDRAAFIVSQKTPSKRDADYLKFAMDATGMTEAEVRAHGQKVRDSIKGMAKGAEPGKLAVPKVYAPKAAPAAKPADVPETDFGNTAAVIAPETTKPVAKVTAKPVDQLTEDEWFGVIGPVEGAARSDGPNEQISIDDAILLKKMVVKTIKDGVKTGKTREQIVSQLEGLTKGGINNGGMARINELLAAQPAAAQVTQPATSGMPEEGAGGSQPPQAAPAQDENSPQSRWTRATTAERIGIARAGGIQLRAAENVAKKAWGDLAPEAQEKLGRGIAKQEGAPAAQPTNTTTSKTTVETSNGEVTVETSFAFSPEMFKQTYGEDGAILNFKMSGDGVTEGMRKLITGVTVKGDMDPASLRTLAVELATAEAAKSAQANDKKGAKDQQAQIQSGLQKTMEAAGWTAEVDGQDNTIWTKSANGELYTASFTPATSNMEVTVLVNGVGTQMDSFKVKGPTQAAEAADAAVASDAQEEAPANVETADTTKKTVDSASKNGPVSVGKNEDGKDLMEDANRLRYYVVDGVRIGEPVRIVPGTNRPAVNLANRRDEFKTVKELAADKPAAPHRIQPGEPGYTLAMAREDLQALNDRNGGMVEDARINSRIKQMEKLIKDMEAEQAKPADPDAEAKAKAQQDLDDALGDLSMILTKGIRKNMLPEQEQALMPVLVKVMDASFRLGYYKFKASAKFVLDTIRAKMGNEAADMITLDHLQGAYIGMAGKYQDKGASTKKEVIAIESLSELDDTPIANQPANTENATPTNDGANNATRQLDQPSPSALEGASAKEVQGTAEQGDSQPATGGRSGGDIAGDAAPGGSGVQPIRGVGNDAGAVPVPSRGTRNKRGITGKRGSEAATGVERQSALFGDDGRGNSDREGSGRVEAPAFKPTDFTIEEDFALGEGGQKTKYRNNIDAIKLLSQLEKEGRFATPDEQAVLAKYVGWGGLAQAFDDKNEGWSKEFAELRDLLTDEEYDAARRSTRYAHYTSRPVIQSMYEALKSFGFTGGRILEPGAGVGNFMGLMPADLRSSSRLTGVERERIAAGIAKQLYPNQNMQMQDFTEFNALDGYFDAVIGNPPFAADGLIDQSGRKHLNGFSVHDFFFAKSIDMLREGGVFAAVVSNGFMDKAGDKARKYIGDRAKLLGAIRLPNNAFAKNANTEVTTDIVFFQKLPESEWGGKAARQDMKRWLDTALIPDPEGGKPIPVNQYFADNPNMMLGDYGRFGSMYGPDQPALVARAGQDTTALLNAAVDRLPKGIYTAAAKANTEKANADLIEALRDTTVDEGGFYVDDGKLYQRMPDQAGETSARLLTPETQWTEKTKLGESKYQRLVELSAMRKTMRQLLAAELSGDKSMEGLRKTLNEQYDAYTATHGLINDASTAQVFYDDPDFPLLAALELSYERGMGPAAAKAQGIKPYKSKAKKAPIFERRVIENRQQVQRAETAEDALNVSIAERGSIDAGYIAQLLGKPADQVLAELTKGAKPLLFVDPVTGEHVLRDAYLSGNVRKKLEQARMAGADDNVRALTAVQPEDVGAHEISAKLGAPWVPATVYEDFAVSLLGEGTKAKVTYIPVNSSFTAMVNAGSDAANTVTFGTRDMPATKILDALLNNRTVKVTYIDVNGKNILDKEKTDLAQEKAQDIKSKFQDWLFTDPERSELLVRSYNDANNNYVTRQFDGSHMTFPGKVPDSIIKFRRHQRNAIARIVQDRTALLDHVVGAGKTFTVISGAMELKRTGLAKKPMIVVPNHLVKQWATDFYRLYPGAKILTATKKDFEKNNRRRFLAKIATGDWDAVIMAHSSFGFVQPDPEFETAFNQSQVDKIMLAIEEAKSDDGDKSSKRRTVKQLEGMTERLENRIKSLREKPVDNLLDFKQLGVDQLFVDEAHLFKNLMFGTKMQNVRGLGDSKGSQRAYDMYVKVNQIYAQNGRGQGVVFATGTPVSNSLAEMYHMMRYLMPQAMDDGGFGSFDAWANTYAEVSQVWMQKTSGDGFKASDRMGTFSNVHELLKMFDQVSDTVTMDDIKQAFAEENNGKEFPLPKLKNDRRTPVSLEKSQAQIDYMDAIAERAKALEQKKGPPQKGEDNFLTIMSDARKAAMDIRLVDPNVTQREPGARIDRASDEVVKRYKQYDSVKGTQLVFSDLGTPLNSAKKELKEYEALQERIAPLQNEDLAASAALGDEAAMRKIEDAEVAQEEMDAKGSDWLGAVQAAMRGFSVYDDMKAALIEKGIPENEIAFIHDFSTDDQKAALFRKVNSGIIRVVIGSTPKMGAGTNVQERLVALHHLDVPWKPSDIEQREGRIIRQGNMLPETMTGFEVEVLAYVTQDTLDMRMWQTQEVKLKMINQLRTRQMSREIENPFEEAEMSAGEMQAAATGNMDLLKEIQLRTDVKKLEQRKRSFDAQRGDLANRKRRAEQNVASLPGRIKGLEILSTAANEYLKSVENPDFSATINGKDYTSRDLAELELRRLVDENDEFNKDKAKDDMRKLSVDFNGKVYGSKTALGEALTSHAGDRDPIAWTFDGETFNRRSSLSKAIQEAVVDAGTTDTAREIGTLGRFTVTVEGNRNKLGVAFFDVSLTIDGKTDDTQVSYTAGGDARVQADAVIRAVERLADNIPGRYNMAQQDLKTAQKAVEDLAKVDMPETWPEMGKLDAARAQHKEVLDRLAGKDEKKPHDDGEVKPVFSRAPATLQAYEARIDALFAGEKASRTGVTILDSSDVMGLLKYSGVPLVLNEAHIAGDGQTNHPEMTSKIWKRIPEWIENPAAVYTDPKHPGRLTLVAPSRVAGYPVVIAIEPDVQRGKPDHLLVTAFAKTTGVLPPMGVLASSGRLLYVDTKMAPEIWSGIGDNPRPTRLISGAKKILTEENLSGYRKAQDPAMSRGFGAGMTKDDAQDVVDGITERWDNAPEVVVVQDMQDPSIPEAVRAEDAKQKSQGASGEPEGFWFGGKAYIVAGALRSPGAVMRVLFHETLGHYGLRGTFGDGLTPILKQLAALRRAEVTAKAVQYGLDMNKEADRLTAAEEVLAEMAQSQPNIGFVKRAIAVIRAFLRKNVPGFAKMKMTDEDIIANYILPARAFVERGPGGGPKGGVAFSRAPNENRSNYAKRSNQDKFWQAFDRGDFTGVGGGIGESEFIDALQGVFEGSGLRKQGRVRSFAERGPLSEVFWPDREIAGFKGIHTTFVKDADGGLNLLVAPTEYLSGSSLASWDDFLDRSILAISLFKNQDGDLEIAFSEAIPGSWARGKLEKSGKLVSTGDKDYTGADYSRLNIGNAEVKNLTREALRRYALQTGSIDGLSIPSRDTGANKDRPRSFGVDTVKAYFSRTTDNNGNTRDATSGMGATELAGQVRDKLNETFNHPGKLSWYHKTLGSQYNLAERNPAYKKVFDAAQSFINDVSYYGTEAANMAPKILPKLQTLRDLAKTAISAADNKAVAAPVFEGTLSWARDTDGKPIRIEALEKRYENLTDDEKAQMLLKKGAVSEAQLKAWKASKLDVYSGAIRNRFESTFLKAGVRWADAELSSIFKLTPEQVELYKEFRAATDTSLDNMAKAQMLREAGKDVEAMRDAVMEAPDVDTAAMMLRELLLDLAKDDPDRADVLKDAAAGVLDSAAKINDLKKQGYAPLSRFGRFTVDVVVGGKREYFGLFESEADSNKMAAKMRMEFGAENVAQGTMSQKEFELFQGITPESLELFGNMMGLDSTGNEAQDKAFQTYLKLTKNNRSAMKRLIHRQGIAGYSEDVGRVLAAFVYANARQTSAALHIGQMDEAITAIPKGEGELKDQALELAKYIKEPREEAAALRGLLFAQYLGGSVASAMVNFTQPLTVSIPYLSQFGGLAKAGKAWAQAVKDMSKGTKLEPGLERALKDAEESGVVSPQEVHQLMAQARGAATLQSGDGTRKGDAIAMAKNGWTRTALAWGKLFGYAEQVNRRSTFIAAYRLAVDQKIANPGAFAEKAVNETQFINNKANKMKFGRGAIGATLMTFKSYSLNWLELMHRMTTQGGPEGKLAAAYMLGALFLVAGAGGLPFADDLEDLIDAIGQKMGYNMSTKKAKQEFLEGVFGKAGAQFVERGLTGIPGVPIDISGRMGMANLIPGTGLLLEKRDSTRDLMEVAGPVGDLAKRMFQAVGELASGEVGKAIESAAPRAAANVIKGVDMLDKGMYRDTKGAKVIDTTPGEAVAKMIGFQPQSVAKVQESNYINQRAKDFYSLKTQEIRAKWAMGIFEGDQDKVKEARQMLDEWNQDNPDQKMTANMPAIIKKVREMRKDKAQRIADTAPKAMRAQMRADARELANQ